MKPRALLALLLLPVPVLIGCGADPATAEPFDPTTAEAAFPGAMEALRAGRPEDALAELDRLAAAGALPEGGLHYRALALADAGREDEALAAWLEELDRHPGNGRAHAFAAELLMERGELERAGEHLDLARRFVSGLPLISLLDGRLALQVGDDERAARSYRGYLAVEPYSPSAAEAHHGLSQVLARRGDPQAALHAQRSEYLESVYSYMALARQALADNPDNVLERFRLAAVYLNLYHQMNRDDVLLRKAEAALQDVLAIDPEFARALFNMGYVRGEQNRLAEAEEYYRKAIAADPEHTAARLNLARLMLAQNRPAEEPAVLLQEVIVLSDKPAEVGQAHGLLGEIKQAAGDWTGAIQHYETMLEMFPDDPGGYRVRLEAIRGKVDEG